MTTPGLRKYQIGLGVLGLFTLVLLIFTIIQAGATKSDNKTFQSAQSTASKLGIYINDQQTIPKSLDQAGATNVPDSIRYNKLSDSSYEFCVTYKASSGFDASQAQAEAFSGLNGYNANNSSGDYGGKNSFLYIDSNHKKGENCQTITPYLSNYGGAGSGSYSDTSTSPYAKCDDQYAKDKNETNYQSCLGSIDKSQSGSSASNNSTPSGSSTNSSALDKAYADCSKQFPDASQDQQYLQCTDKANKANNASSTASPLKPRLY